MKLVCKYMGEKCNLSRRKLKFETIDVLYSYQIERESKAIVGLGRRPEISTSPWLYHISRLHQSTQDQT